MNHQGMSLLDVLAPPGNRWLMELSRRKAELPPGVRIVRFDNGDDEGEQETCASTSGSRRKKKASA